MAYKHPRSGRGDVHASVLYCTGLLLQFCFALGEVLRPLSSIPSSLGLKCLQSPLLAHVYTLAVRTGRNVIAMTANVRVSGGGGRVDHDRENHRCTKPTRNAMQRGQINYQTHVVSGMGIGQLPGELYGLRCCCSSSTGSRSIMPMATASQQIFGGMLVERVAGNSSDDESSPGPGPALAMIAWSSE